MTDRVQRILRLLCDAQTMSVAGIQERPFSQLTFNRVQYIWSMIRKETKVTDPEFTIHSLRHTFASRLVQKGVPLYTVQKLLGHTDIRTTQRYAHLAPDNLKQAIEKLNDHFGHDDHGDCS